MDFSALEDEHAQLKEEVAMWREASEGAGRSGQDGGNTMTSRYPGL
eukprot:SAG11_NODE_2016_length_3919_cov_4.215445_7_plen_46_part_00